MFKYQVNISVDKFSVVLNKQWLKNDKAQPHTKSFKEYKRFTAVQKEMNQIEIDTALAISKTRLNEDY